jgi:hypothetical protein
MVLDTHEIRVLNLSVNVMIKIWQAANIVRREFGKLARMLPNRSMNNLAKCTMLTWSATLIITTYKRPIYTTTNAVIVRRST